MQTASHRYRPLSLTFVLLAFAGCNRDGSLSGFAVSHPTVAASTVAPPHAARAADFADTIHGVVVPDPYRWLEDTASAETREWIQRQRVYSDSVLAQLQLVDSLGAGLEARFAAAPTLGEVVKTSGRTLLTRYLGPTPDLIALDSGAAQEREVISAKALAAANNGAWLRTFVPSFDGKRVAIGTTQQGDANAAITIVDVATGRVLPDAVHDLLTTTSGTRYEVSWLPDGSGFLYPRMWPSVSPSPSAKLARGRQFLHRLGTPTSADVPVFGFDVTPAVPMDADDLPTRVGTSSNSGWMVASLFRSRLNGTDHYAARLAHGTEGAATWRKIASVNDRVSQLKLRGDTVYALSRKDADRAKIVRLVLRDESAPIWETVLPERAGVLTDYIAQDDALYISERSNGALGLLRLPYGATTATSIVLPSTGAVHFTRAQTGNGATVMLESWASPPHALYANGDSARSLGINDGFSANSAAELTADRLQAPSTDGTLVPVSVVYGPKALRNGKLDGTAPLLIDAYGGFGVVTDEAFDPVVQYWVSLGGVYAYAGVRGGGERGEAWHLAATREKKQRSADDMIGAIEQLIAKRYTSAKRVSIIGVSFGANIPGLVMLQRPDLLSAVLYEVGQPDEIRGAAFDPTAARNIAEIGDLDTPEGIRSLMKMSPYHQIPARVDLPAVIVHTARADYNFGSQMLTAKYVARLQRANSGNNPILWVQTDGGHRPLFGSGPEWAGRALSFMLWNAGVARYQPGARRDP